MSTNATNNYGYSEAEIDAMASEQPPAWLGESEAGRLPIRAIFSAQGDLLVALLEKARAAIRPVYGESKQRIGLNAGQAGNTDYPAFARYGLPYHLQERAGDRAILLNRDYKPVGLGIPSSLWVDYDAFPQWHVSGAALARAIGSRDCWIPLPENAKAPHCWMFHDGCPPWSSSAHLRAYARRLDALIDALSPSVAIE
jgi:hypothetical protein